MGLRPTVVRLIRKLAYIGIVETDGDAIRAQKATLTIAAIVLTALSCVWVGTYVVGRRT